MDVPYLQLDADSPSTLLPQSRLPMDLTSFLTDNLASVITTATGFVTAVAAATQLSYRHRMMRTATWAKEQLSESTGERRTYLTLLLRWAQSEVAASTMVPSAVLLEPLLTASVAFLTPILGNSPGIWQFFSTLSILTLLFRRSVRLYLERRRCARYYYLNKPVHPVHIGILSQMEGGTRKEFLWAICFAIEVTSMSTSFSYYYHHGNKIALLLAGSISIITWITLACLRALDRHPFLGRI